MIHQIPARFAIAICNFTNWMILLPCNVVSFIGREGLQITPWMHPSDVPPVVMSHQSAQYVYCKSFFAVQNHWKHHGPARVGGRLAGVHSLAVRHP